MATKRSVVRKAAATQVAVTKKATAVKTKAVVATKKTVASAKRKVAEVAAA